ncbi:MAG: DNA-methyltransferase [Candidatus Woesearchaeota archaeon]
MKTYKVKIKGKEVIVKKDDDGKFIKPKIALELESKGTAIKPSHEPIVLARKPIKEKSIVEQVLNNGCGGLDIDGCRIPTNKIVGWGGASGFKNTHNASLYGGLCDREARPNFEGRFPANVICSDDALNDGKITKTKPHGGDGKPLDTKNMGWGFKRMPSNLEDSGSKSRYFDLDIWAEKQGILNIPKPSKAEKNKGCERNNHPTTKPVKLMAWLVKLVSKEGDTVLDPFLGSGTTGVACKKLNRNFIGIEKEEEYITIANARIKAVSKQQRLNSFTGDE